MKFRTIDPVLATAKTKPWNKPPINISLRA